MLHASQVSLLILVLSFGTESHALHVTDLEQEEERKEVNVTRAPKEPALAV